MRDLPSIRNALVELTRHLIFRQNILMSATFPILIVNFYVLHLGPLKIFY